MNRVRVIYHGTVQGVGFRWTCRAAAEDHPVTGWVRNEPDGSVMLEAQGDQDAIDALLADIDDKMAGNIRSKETETIPIQPDETAFRIARWLSDARRQQPVAWQPTQPGRRLTPDPRWCPPKGVGVDERELSGVVLGFLRQPEVEREAGAAPWS